MLNSNEPPSCSSQITSNCSFGSNGKSNIQNTSAQHERTSVVPIPVSVPGPASSLQASNQTDPGQSQVWMITSAADVMRQRMSFASDQLNSSMRHFYNSASSITADAATTSAYLTGVVNVNPPPAYHNIPGVVPYYHGRSSGPPPSYEDVVNPFAAPPSYQSLFGQVREARKSSRGFLDLIKKLLIILLSTLGCTLLIALMILIPFTMIVVGAVYIDDCRVEHIPTFLLLGGIVWASKNVLHCYGQCQKIESRSSHLDGPDDFQTANQLNTNYIDQSQDPNQHQHFDRRNQHRFKSSICESLLSCVLIGWFIAGCVIVFRNYEPDFDNIASPRYCNKTVYMYTFWLITSAIMVFSLFVSCICCLMVNSIVSQRQQVITNVDP